MKRSDWMILGLVGVMAMWAMALLAQPLLPKPESTGLKVVELVIAAASSFGTMVAAMVALYFGLKSQRDQRAMDRRVAMLTATRLHVRLTHLANEVAMLDACWDDHLSVREQMARAKAYVDLGGFDEAMLEVDDAPLLRLAAMFPDAPVDLARALEELKRVRYSVVHVPDAWKEVEGLDMVRIIVRDNIKGSLDRAKQTIYTLQEETRKLARL